MKKAIRLVLWILVACVFVGTFMYLYNNSRSHEPVYSIVRPSVNDIERSSLLTGKIEPRDEIEIKPQISGIIAEINVEPGEQGQGRRCDSPHQGDSRREPAVGR